MKDDESEIVDLIVIRETEKALLVQTKSGDQVWLPRPQISYLRKNPRDAKGVQTINVTIPDWLVDEKGLE